MTLKAYTEWTPKELWEHEQLNFSLHIAIMLQYLQAHGLVVDDFIRYTGEKVLPSCGTKMGRGSLSSYKENAAPKVESSSKKLWQTRSSLCWET